MKRYLVVIVGVVLLVVSYIAGQMSAALGSTYVNLEETKVGRFSDCEVSVLVDTETGVNYFMVSRYSYGLYIQPRLDSDGKIFVSK